MISQNKKADIQQKFYIKLMKIQITTDQGKIRTRSGFLSFDESMQKIVEHREKEVDNLNIRFIVFCLKKRKREHKLSIELIARSIA